MSANREDDDRGRRGGYGTDLIDRPPETEAVRKLAHPPLYKVFLHNDDYTPFEFVVMVLRHAFGLSEQKAAQIMIAAHEGGVGGLCLVGIWTRDVAETKLAVADAMIRKAEQPLKFSMEKED
jgi:ATP-dependent Clp protease adaptor protein ClpS